MTTEDIEKVKTEAVEEYRKNVVKKIDGIYKILGITRPVDDSGKLTQEEMLAIKSGARSAYAYVLGLLGADGEQTERENKEIPDLLLAKGTVIVGAEIHHGELRRYGL